MWPVKLPRLGGEEAGADAGLAMAKTACSLRSMGQAGTDADEVADRLGVAARSGTDGGAAVCGSPLPPPGAGGLRYKP